MGFIGNFIGITSGIKTVLLVGGLVAGVATAGIFYARKEIKEYFYKKAVIKTDSRLNKNLKTKEARTVKGLENIIKENRKGIKLKEEK